MKQSDELHECLCGCGNWFTEHDMSMHYDAKENEAKTLSQPASIGGTEQEMDIFQELDGFFNDCNGASGDENCVATGSSCGSTAPGGANEETQATQEEEISAEQAAASAPVDHSDGEARARNPVDLQEDAAPGAGVPQGAVACEVSFLKLSDGLGALAASAGQRASSSGAAARAQVARLREQVTSRVNAHLEEFERYGTEPLTTSELEQRSRRNAARVQLLPVVEDTRTWVALLLDSSSTPLETLATEKKNFLDDIDGKITRLQQLRSKVVQDFQVEEATLMQDLESGKVAATELLGLLERLRGFVRCYEKEVQDETAEALKYLHRSLLAESEKEKLSVLSNLTEQAREAQRHVQVDIRLRDEQHTIRARAARLLHEWEDLCSRVPAAAPLSPPGAEDPPARRPPARIPAPVASEPPAHRRGWGWPFGGVKRPLEE